MRVNRMTEDKNKTFITSKKIVSGLKKKHYTFIPEGPLQRGPEAIASFAHILIRHWFCATYG